MSTVSIYLVMHADDLSLIYSYIYLGLLTSLQEQTTPIVQLVIVEPDLFL
jgi:hypothetical protein